ncbi:pectate lyase [Roseateles sp. PN1]|uniref:pectate lyase n=1 Tax=Roseateles sp. PN1 TaxID=3137372 RepID=UPI0031398E3E
MKIAPWMLASLLGLGQLLAADGQAAVIGVNVPAVSLTVARIEMLPLEQRKPWLAYLARSQQQREVDRAALAAERAALPPGSPAPAPPEGGHADKSMPLNQAPAWYASAAARRVADNIVSFQTPAGGWGKNQPRDRPPRLSGQDYVADNNSPRAVAGDFDLAENPRWSYVGTIDNDATITEVRFLAKVAVQLPESDAAPYRASALKGLAYLLAAQFPNGGWPQVWPLQGGYHDAVTLNDNAVVEVAELLGEVGQGATEWGFVPAELRKQALAAEQRAIALLLASQVSIDGRKRIWAQQYDALSLAPVAARNYEPASLCTGESVDVLLYLMRQTQPTAEMKRAVEAGIASLRELAVADVKWARVDDAQGRRLTSKPGAGPLWARYYDALSLKPVFGDRDKTLHDDVNELSLERRNGYAWFGTWPLKALAAYEPWSRRWLKPEGAARP